MFSLLLEMKSFTILFYSLLLSHIQLYSNFKPGSAFRDHSCPNSGEEYMWYWGLKLGYAMCKIVQLTHCPISLTSAIHTFKSNYIKYN